MRIKFFNKLLLKSYLNSVSIMSLFLSFTLIFFPIPLELQGSNGAFIFLAILLLIYFIQWIIANKLVKITLSINNNVIEVVFGDLFECEGLISIPFNEYFDTIVDEKIIMSSSLNGYYIQNCVTDIQELDEYIYKNCEPLNINDNRKAGKKFRYPLGTIVRYNDSYILTAFSIFDSNNRAYITKADYFAFLLSFWDNVDKIYAGNDINIPLFGSGVTRFKDGNVTEQELLELILCSIKTSSLSLPHNNRIRVVLKNDEILKTRIELFRVREG